MDSRDTEIFLWVPYPNQIAGLYNDLDKLKENCREHDISADEVSVSLVDIETRGAWMTEDESSLFECHLSLDQPPLDAPSELIWDWTSYVKGSVVGDTDDFWRDLDSGTFWRYPNMDALVADMMPADAHRVPYVLADFVFHEVRGEWP